LFICDPFYWLLVLVLLIMSISYLALESSASSSKFSVSNYFNISCSFYWLYSVTSWIFTPMFSSFCLRSSKVLKLCLAGIHRIDYYLAFPLSLSILTSLSWALNLINPLFDWSCSTCLVVLICSPIVINYFWTCIFYLCLTSSYFCISVTLCSRRWVWSSCNFYSTFWVTYTCFWRIGFWRSRVVLALARCRVNRFANKLRFPLIKSAFLLLAVWVVSFFIGSLIFELAWIALVGSLSSSLLDSVFFG